MRQWSLAVTVGLAVLLSANPVRAQLNTNLIVNPGAEAGAGSADGGVVPIPGWTVTGNFTAVNWDAPGGFPVSGDPGPADRGENFFAGGPNNAGSSASQVIDISSIAGLVDAGGVTFSLSGFLGGFTGQNDNATLTVSFRDTLNAVLGAATIGPVTDADRGGNTALLLRTTGGGVPVATRNLLVELVATRTAGAYNDGYADNLSVVLQNAGGGANAPEPATLALLGMGMAALALRHRK